MTDERLNTLGKALWVRVVTIEAFHLASQYGTPNVRASVGKLLHQEEMELWGDLQTLFRGGVFPEDMEPIP